MVDYKEHEKWMKYALDEANNAKNNDEVPVGAVIVNGNNIIGRGYNQIESLKDSTAHAEIISITSASNTIGDWRLNNCSLYVTKQPCLMCMGAIINSRIRKLFYGMHDISSEYNIKDSDYINNKHLKFIEGGILLHECRDIIQKFFIKKR